MSKKLFLTISAVIFLLTVNTCSGKKSAGQNEHPEKIAGQIEQLETVTAELETSQMSDETTGGQLESEGSANRNVSNEEQPILDETPSASSTPQNESAQTPAPAAPVTSAPRYAIGDAGPGGGIVYMVSGGTLWEVYPKAFRWAEYREFFVPGVGYVFNDVQWSLAPSIEHLSMIHNNLEKTGKTNFGSIWINSSTELANAPKENKGNDFPGYYIVLAKGGGAPLAMRMSDGLVGVQGEEGGVYTNENNTFFNEPVFDLLHRTVGAANTQ